jgi:hypothetical protein
MLMGVNFSAAKRVLILASSLAAVISLSFSGNAEAQSVAATPQRQEAAPNAQVASGGCPAAESLQQTLLNLRSVAEATGRMMRDGSISASDMASSVDFQRSLAASITSQLHAGCGSPQALIQALSGCAATSIMQQAAQNMMMLSQITEMASRNSGIAGQSGMAIELQRSLALSLSSMGAAQQASNLAGCSTGGQSHR